MLSSCFRDRQRGLTRSDNVPGSGFDAYFHERAGRFSAFYRSEPISRLLGRGALFDRLSQTVAVVVALRAQSVLDVGCGSGPLFAPLAERGVQVTGIDPAPAMVELARQAASKYPDLVTVREQGWEEISDQDAYDVAAALGVMDYVADPVALLSRMGRAAPNVVVSIPAPGLRVRLRQIRYGARGVQVHGYSREQIARMASASGLAVAQVKALGRAGYLVHFSRAGS